MYGECTKVISNAPLQKLRSEERLECLCNVGGMIAVCWKVVSAIFQIRCTACSFLEFLLASIAAAEHEALPEGFWQF